MQAIATLVNDDPWLKMPREERIASRRRRREIFKPCMLSSPVVRLVEPILPSQAIPDPADLAPICENDLIAEWVKRQKDIPVHADMGPPSFPRKISTVDIQRKVASHFDLSWKTMFSRHRHGRVVFPRQIAMYLTHKLVGISLPDIGRRFGGRDHTTVLHAVRKIQRMMAEDTVLEAGIDRLCAEIVEGRA